MYEPPEGTTHTHIFRNEHLFFAILVLVGKYKKIDSEFNQKQINVSIFFVPQFFSWAEYNL